MQKKISAFKELLDVLKKLREPGGCPWDIKQTNSSLRDSLIEETYEVIEAIDNNDVSELEEELGDLFFLVLFHILIGEQENKFSIESVITKIKDKLIRRHPHVFSDIQVESVKQVLQNWEKIKSEEKKESGDKDKLAILKSIPSSMPSLQRTYRIINKLQRLEETDIDEKNIIEKLNMEIKKLDSTSNKNDLSESIKNILYNVVLFSYKNNLKPEDLLRNFNSDFIRSKMK